LVIFDCDGVLIDSEVIANEVVARNLTRLGWGMDAAESMRVFMGMSIIDMQPVIEARLQRSLPADWRLGLATEIAVALGRGVQMIPGAKEILRRVSEMGIAWRVASNSSVDEMDVKFRCTGLSETMAGRAHAASDVGRPKPAPDVYLHAARAEGVAVADCLVVEDSVTGVTAAVAAGMRCYGFAPHGDGAALLAAGAVGILKQLSELEGVLV
jgi:HAD superfamily hydrolase (TIGR01509 family)